MVIDRYSIVRLDYRRIHFQEFPSPNSSWKVDLVGNSKCTFSTSIVTTVSLLTRYIKYQHGQILRTRIYLIAERPFFADLSFRIGGEDSPRTFAEGKREGDS